MKKLTKEQWEGVKERFYKHIPWTPSYLKPEDAERMDKEILFFFEKEVVEDTETPETNCVQIGDTVACSHCQPEKGYDTMEKYGLECDCNCHKKQPESSWEMKTKKKVINDYGNQIAQITLDFIKGDHSEVIRDSRYEDAGFLCLKEIDIIVSEAEKRGFNLALEEAEKAIDWSPATFEEEDILNNQLQVLKALKK